MNNTPRKNRTRPYSLGLYEKALPADMPLEKKLSEASRLGFDRLELSIDESRERLARLDWSDAEKRRLAVTCGSVGTPIRSICLSAHRKYPMGSADPALREKSMEILYKAIDLAAETGISIIQLAGYDVYYEPGSDLTRSYFAENLYRAAAAAAKSGVLLGFETMETPFMDTVQKAMRYVTELGSPWLGIYPDIGNLQNAAALYGTDIEEDFRLGSGHILALHLKETAPGVYRNLRLGCGHTQYGRFLRCAKQLGVRMFTGEFWLQPGQDYEHEVSAAAGFLRARLDEAFDGG